MDAYKIVKRGSATLALINGALYLFAVWVSIGDGNRVGFEIPAELAAGWAALGGVLAMTAIAAWVVERGYEETARRVVIPIIEQAIRDAMAKQTPLVARGVAQVVTGGLDLKLQAVANRASDRTVASMREAITRDLTDIVEAGLGRAQRYGMTRQAMAQAGGTNGNVVHLTPPGK